MIPLPAALLLLAPLWPAQEASGGQVEPERIRGRVVSDVDGAPVENVSVEPEGLLPVAWCTLATLDQDRCWSAKATEHTEVGYFRITAPGHSVAFVDPSAEVPWEQIRVRAGATLAGRLEGQCAGHWVRITAPAAELTWPPRSGLVCPDEVWTVRTESDGTFEISGLPAQVPLMIRAILGSGLEAETQIVLRPGERRDYSPTDTIEAPQRSEPLAATPCVPIHPSSWDGTNPGERETAWFEFASGGRRRQHPHGRAGMQAHHYRACSRLEALPGRRVLVARDAEGWIGTAPVEAVPGEIGVHPRVELRPGALLRIDATGLEAPSRLTLSHDGLAFVEAELLPGVVRFEVVPAGKVEVRVAAEGHEPRGRVVETTAGNTSEVRL